MIAEEVLGHLREQFLEKVDANVIMHQLHRFQIVSTSEMVTIMRCHNKDEQNNILLEILQHNCDEKKLKTVCDVMENSSSPTMQSVAYEIEKMLDSTELPKKSVQASSSAYATELPKKSVQASSSANDHPQHLMLFRTYVSRRADRRGRAFLEALGLNQCTIDVCFMNNPSNSEEAVQDGLLKWAGGFSRTPPTWGALLTAMEYADISQQDIQGLKQKLGFY